MNLTAYIFNFFHLDGLYVDSYDRCAYLSSDPAMSKEEIDMLEPVLIVGTATLVFVNVFICTVLFNYRNDVE